MGASGLFMFTLRLIFLGTCSGYVTKSYPCPAGQDVFTIQHEMGNVLNCEQTWIMQNITIAMYTTTGQCAVPCVNVSHGGISLSECVNVVLTITCESHVLTEKRIAFIGKKDLSSPVPTQDHPGSTTEHSKHIGTVGLIVALILFVPLICVAVYYICGCQQPLQLVQRNPGQSS